MLRVFLILFVGISLLASVYYISVKKGDDWLSPSQRSNALVSREDIGFDFIECTKLEITPEQAEVALHKLSLQSMEKYPKYDTSPANCHIDWWDVDFPSEANWYALESDGKFRYLAAMKDGFFYYTRELR